MKTNLDDKAARERWRSEYVDQFLGKIGVPRELLAGPTLTCLGEWARQVQLVTDQPSANWGTVLLQLCRAVESELASSLGLIPGLQFFAKGEALGKLAEKLRHTTLDGLLEQRLTSCGIKPGFVCKTLPQKLSDLAKLRRETGSAHGSAQIPTVTMEDARRACDLAGDILKGIVRTAGKGPK